MGETTSTSASIGRVALFNGPPSSGKTSLVSELQNEIAEPWFHLSLDDFRSGFSERWWLEDDGHLFDRVLSGYLRSLREMALAGNDLLAEAVITPERHDLYESAFGALPIILIGVKCPREVAVQRENARTDRRHGPIDLPAHDYAAVHVGLSYDFEVETSTGNPVEMAAKMVPQFDRLLPSSFKRHLV
jgi:chloramphenicol 3-O phosphotransferase